MVPSESEEAAPFTSTTMRFRVAKKSAFGGAFGTGATSIDAEAASEKLVASVTVRVTV